MAGNSWCRCNCHHEARGNALDARQRGDASAVAYFAGESHLDIPPLVDLFSELEALVACHRCGPHHVRLKAPPPRYKPPTKWEPQSDQGDGGE